MWLLSTKLTQTQFLNASLRPTFIPLVHIPFSCKDPLNYVCSLFLIEVSFR